MNALDKRIGNYIYHYPGFDSPQYKQPRYLAKITNLNESGVYGYEILEKHPDAYHKCIEEIKLTEYWLLKSGFKHQDRDVNTKTPERFYISELFGKNKEYWIELQLKESTSFGYSFVWLCWNIGGGNNRIHLPVGHQLEYLHTLQNWWTVWTGEELTIKEETK